MINNFVGKPFIKLSNDLDVTSQNNQKVKIKFSFTRQQTSSCCRSSDSRQDLHQLAVELGDAAVFPAFFSEPLSSPWSSSSGRLVHSRRFEQKPHIWLTTIFSPFTRLLTKHRWLHFRQDLKSCRMQRSSTTNSDELRETEQSGGPETETHVQRSSSSPSVPSQIHLVMSSTHTQRGAEFFLLLIFNCE